MKIKVFPRYKIKKMLQDHGEDFFKSINLISINDSETLVDELSINAPKNCLSLVFDDLEPGFNRYGNFFTEAQAKQVLNFVYSIDRSKDLYVHCLMGVSRSAAVAEFIHVELMKKSFQEFKDANPHTIPNMHVYKTLLNVFHRL